MNTYAASAMVSDWPEWAVKPTPGVVYRHFDVDGLLLYVGSTDRLRLRIRHRTHAREARWWRFVARIEHEFVEPDRRAAYLAEATAIRTERPVFNRFASRACPVQEHRERRYLHEHASTPDRWSIPSARPSSMKRGQWTAQIDAMLDELGLASTSRPALPQPPPPDPPQLALFA